MSNTNHTTGPILGFNMTEPDGTTAKHALGTTCIGTNGTEWVYVKSGEAITQYMTVAIDEDYTAKKITTALAQAAHKIGFAQFAFTASNQYGVVATRGSDIQILVKLSCAADIALYTTASAGVLDDTVTTTLQQIKGVVVITAATSSFTQAEQALATWPRTVE